MRQVFQCELCGSLSDSEQECRECEQKHKKCVAMEVMHVEYCENYKYVPARVKVRFHLDDIDYGPNGTNASGIACLWFSLMPTEQNAARSISDALNGYIR